MKGVNEMDTVLRVFSVQERLKGFFGRVFKKNSIKIHEIRSIIYGELKRTAKLFDVRFTVQIRDKKISEWETFLIRGDSDISDALECASRLENGSVQIKWSSKAGREFSKIIDARKGMFTIGKEG
jgi:hypothetical protein